MSFVTRREERAIENLLWTISEGDELVRNENLFQFILFLGEFQTTLNDVAIGGFPHVVVFDDSLETFPR